MKKKPLFILTWFLFLSQIGTAQIVFKYGPELGIAFSRFSKKWYSQYLTPNGTSQSTITETLTPLISPVVALNGQLIIVKNLQISSGLQYQMVGDRYYIRHEGKTNAGINYTSEYWEKQTFHKLCMPISIGYTFRIGKTFPCIYAGDRFNFFISAKNFSKYTSTSELPSEYEFDPFKCGIPPKRFANQIFAGISIRFGQHYNMSLTYNLGGEPYYSEPMSCFVDYFRNTDYILSFAYLFTKVKTKKETIY